MEDLRNLLLYLKENGMDIEDLNQLIYHLSKKYEFDPFRYEINLLTGIVSERKNQFNPYEEIRIGKQSRLENIKEPHQEALTTLYETKKKRDITIEHVDNRRTIYRINPKVEDPSKKPDINEYLKEFRRWINQNKLDIHTVRKMISLIEEYKRHQELKPNEYYERPEEIIELQEWIEDRNLDYLKVRMMLAIIDQQEANLKSDMIIAR